MITVNTSKSKMTSLVVFLFPLFMAARVAQASYVVETLFIVDPQVTNLYSRLGYENDTIPSILTGDIDFGLLEINKFFSSMSEHGLDIEVRMKDLIIMEEEMFEECKLINGQLQVDLGLAVIKDWLTSATTASYDIAVVLTGYDLFSSSSASATTGYAPLGSTCISPYNIALAEFSGTQSSFITIAHEIGHNLGSKHDGDGNLCDPSLGYVMTPGQSAHNENRWLFTSCSTSGVLAYLEELDANDNNCLTETTAPALPDLADQAGRDVLDAHRICQRFRKTQNSYLCAYSSMYDGEEPRGDNVCQYIACGLTGSTGCRYAAPSDWMACDVGKRCDKGSCVAAPAELPVSPTEVTSDCVFGDVQNGNLDCAQTLQDLGTSQCYSTYVVETCCASCEAVKTGIADCMYGDRSTDCDLYTEAQVCPRYSNICCYKCRNFRRKRSNEASPLPAGMLKEDSLVTGTLPTLDTSNNTTDVVNAQP